VVKEIMEYQTNEAPVEGGPQSEAQA